MKLGLCCAFSAQPIRFRTTTARALSKLNPGERCEKIRTLGRANADALMAAILFCNQHQIGCFRINSQILPLFTHPTLGYSSNLLGEDIIAMYRRCGETARELGVRLSFHPDQFVVLSSPHKHVVANSLAELEYQGEVAQWLGADVINIHGGGGYGDKKAALNRFQISAKRLSRRVLERLTLENDDRLYTPTDLLPVCESLGIPFVYDVHHHRCLPDGESVSTITARALKTWNRTPLFHVSSPRDGWNAANPRPHHDYIQLRDVPIEWRRLECTIEVEAKAKELSVVKLNQSLARWAARDAAIGHHQRI